MKETILQFGTGGFLRAFADWFIDGMRKSGLYDGSVVIVSPTDSGRIDLLQQQECKYHLLLRGLENGATVNDRYAIGSVSRAINPYRSFEDYLALATLPTLRFMISNTTESGIEYREEPFSAETPAVTFPGKLTQLLFARYGAGLPGLIHLPCELIDANGDALRRCVLRYAEHWKLGEGFLRWIEEDNVFSNTLVDRIVTGYPAGDADALCREIGWNDRLLDAAEPYHLWVIEGNYEKELPLCAAGFNVIWTEDVSPYKKRKVRVLNGAHTSIVFPALLSGIGTVGECLRDPLLNQYLQKCLFGAILPVLGDTQENRDFAASVLERFANPFIRHSLRSIALNSVSKFAVRVLPTMLEFREAYGVVPKPQALSLAALIAFYKTDAPTDKEEHILFIRGHEVPEILRNADLWGQDLSVLTPDVLAAAEKIGTIGMREAIKWSIS